MRIANTLKRLASRAASPWPVLSVYVNTRPVGPQMTTYRPLLKRRMAEELGALPPRSPERESLAVDFARAQHYLDYDLRPEIRAAAVFSSYAGDDTFDAVQLPVEFPEPRIVVGPTPVLGPLLVVADRALPAVVLVAAERTARLFEITLGAVATRREVRTPTGPEGEDRAQPTRFARVVAQALADLAATSGATIGFLGGEPNLAGAVRLLLPSFWRGDMLEAGTWEPRITEDALAADVAGRVRMHREAARVASARALLASAASGRGALGVDPARHALHEGGVNLLLFARDFADPATIEELSALALSRDAAVQFVPPGIVPEFDAHGVGVARD